MDESNGLINKIPLSTEDVKEAMIARMGKFSAANIKAFGFASTEFICLSAMNAQKF